MTRPIWRPAPPIWRRARTAGVAGAPGHGDPRPGPAATRSTPALDDAARQLGGLDTVVITAGAFGTQEALEADAAARERVLSTNFTQTIQLCEAARVRLLASGGGTLCVLGSVAGDRARKPVVLYGATKAGLAYYMHGIDLRYRDAGLRAVLVKPGFVRTGMTAGLPEPPFAANPEDVAPAIVRAIDRGTPQIYVPAIWRW